MLILASLLTMTMMKLMNSSDHYRLAALLEIAWAAPETLAITEIARRREIPAAYLAQLLRELRRDGWVVSRRGPRGGIALARDPNDIPIAAVLAAPDGREATPGALGRLERTLTTALTTVLAGLTLEDLLTWERHDSPSHGFDI